METLQINAYGQINDYKAYDIDEFDDSVKLTPYHFSFDIYFDQTLITYKGEPKYLVGLYQDGDIWSEDEVWGTTIIDLDSFYDCTYSCIQLGCFINTNIKSILETIENNKFDESYLV